MADWVPKAGDIVKVGARGTVPWTVVDVGLVGAQLYSDNGRWLYALFSKLGPWK